MGVRDFRARVRQVIDGVTGPGGAPVVVGSRRPEVVVMSVVEYDALMARAMANDTVREAVTNQRLEGLEPTGGEVAVLLDVAEGRVSVAEATAAALDRIRARAVTGQPSAVAAAGG